MLLLKRATSDLGRHIQTESEGMDGERYSRQTETIKAKTAICGYSDKTNVKIKTITRDDERHYLTIQESIHEEDITVANINAPKYRT